MPNENPSRIKFCIDQATGIISPSHIQDGQWQALPKFEPADLSRSNNEQSRF